MFTKWIRIIPGKPYHVSICYFYICNICHKYMTDFAKIGRKLLFIYWIMLIHWTRCTFVKDRWNAPEGQAVESSEDGVDGKFSDEDETYNYHNTVASCPPLPVYKIGVGGKLSKQDDTRTTDHIVLGQIIQVFVLFTEESERGLGR